MPGTITRATEADLPQLLTLIQEFYAIDRHVYEESHVVGALVPLLTDDRSGQVWLIDHPDPAEPAPDGYAVVTWSWSLESGGLDCILDELYLRSRGRGLGAVALRQVVAAAQAFGARAMFLETEAHNERVRGFYARQGFDFEDSVWMSRRLV